MVDETYTGSLRGQQFTAKIRWAPGDEPGVVRRGRGIITTADGQQIPVEGVQSGPDAAEFSIKPGDTGETYKTKKATGAGGQSWQSEVLTLTEKK